MLPVLIGIEGLELSSEEVQAIRMYQPVGFVLFSRNIETFRQVQSLTNDLRSLCHHDPVIAIDQEGGRVIRTNALGWLLPSPRQIRTSGTIDDVVSLARLTAQGLRCLGVNLNFAPVLDICHDESVKNALPSRCWGAHAQDVINYAGVYLRQQQYHGVLSCGKHFPGMGMALSDPHFDLPSVSLSEQDLLAEDMIPFMTLCPELASVMTSHVMFPQLDQKHPVTTSSIIIQRLLREIVGFNRVVFTDDLCMGAIINTYGLDEAYYLSRQAGCDLPLICHDPLQYLSLIEEKENEVDDELRVLSSKRVQKMLACLSLPFESSNLWQDVLIQSEQLHHQFLLIQELGNSPVNFY